MALHGIDAVYVPFPVTPADFPQALPFFSRIGVCGLNVTLPHKASAFPVCDFCDADAVRSGAVNTITFRPDGQIHGTNTDVDGFVRHLQAGAPDWQQRTQAAMVLGAGGAARAVVTALQKKEVPLIRIVNRNRVKAQALVADLVENGASQLELVPFAAAERHLSETSLLINATSLGMENQPPLVLSLENLPSHAIVYDIVYKPLETELLQEAKMRGLLCFDGLGMLIQQARLSFQCWFGILPDANDDFRTCLL